MNTRAILPKRQSRFYQQGMNLVEIMVAMTLGLVLVGGAGQIFLSNTQAFRLQDSVSNLQQSGRLVMEMMLADIRRAGLDIPKLNAANSIIGREGSAAAAGIAGLLQNSDEITVAYVAPEDMTDCEGNPAVAGTTVRNRYFVRQDGNPNIAALFCAGAVTAIGATTAVMPSTAANAGTALLRGVESLQIIYGVAPTTNYVSNGYASPARYVSATPTLTAAISPAPPGCSPLPTLPPPGCRTPVEVGAVQVALLVRTEVGIAGVSAPGAAIRVMGGTNVTGAPPVAAATLAAVTVNGQFPVHRLFAGTAAVRNAAATTFTP